MKTITLDDVRHELILDSYSTCKYIERQGVSLEDVTLGNVHKAIEEMVDDHKLPVTQILNDNMVEGYIIGA